jgi:hypothetical protein
MDESGEAEGAGEGLLVLEPASAPPAVRDFEDTSSEVDEDEYWEVIERPERASKPLLEELHTEGRPKGLSSASSNSSLSPTTISPDSATAGQDFPFSIDCPPPADILDEQLLTVPYSSSPKGIVAHRLRGDSVSGMSTDGKQQYW